MLDALLAPLVLVQWAIGIGLGLACIYIYLMMGATMIPLALYGFVSPKYANKVIKNLELDDGIFLSKSQTYISCAVGLVYITLWYKICSPIADAGDSVGERLLSSEFGALIAFSAIPVIGFWRSSKYSENS